jgi:hypothetical protein
MEVEERIDTEDYEDSDEYREICECQRNLGARSSDLMSIEEKIYYELRDLACAEWRLDNLDNQQSTNLSCADEAALILSRLSEVLGETF